MYQNFYTFWWFNCFLVFMIVMISKRISVTICQQESAELSS